MRHPHAQPAGALLPRKEDASAIDRGAQQNEHDDYADAQRRALAAIQARAALAGCTLHELADGYLICRHDLSTYVPCLRCVGDLVRRMGGWA